MSLMVAAGPFGHAPQGRFNFERPRRDGVIYWEPAWISSPAKDLWGTGSSWENCAFFDFDGNAIKVFDYMKPKL